MIDKRKIIARELRESTILREIKESVIVREIKESTTLREIKEWWNEIFPIAIDLNNDGVGFIPLNISSALYNMGGNALRDKTAWISSKDAWLSIDTNGDNAITETEEIVFTQHLAGSESDMEALRAVFDSNKNNRLDPADQRWPDFRIWQDNGDGISAHHELLTLNEAGIKSISLDFQNSAQPVKDGDVKVIRSVSIEWEEGKDGGMAYDVVLPYSETITGQLNEV